MVVALSLICILSELFYLFVYPYSKTDILEDKMKKNRGGVINSPLTTMDAAYVVVSNVYMLSLIMLLIMAVVYYPVFLPAPILILIFWILKYFYNPCWNKSIGDRIVLIFDSVASILILLYTLVIHFQSIL